MQEYLIAGRMGEKGEERGPMTVFFLHSSILAFLRNINRQGGYRVPVQEAG